MRGQFTSWGTRKVGELAPRFATSGAGFIADLHGRELRDSDFMRVWEPAARTPLQLALEALRRHPEPIVLTADARAGEAAVKMEVLFAPLRGPSGQLDRVIGLYQPLTPVAVLHGGVVRALTLTGVSSTATPWVLPPICQTRWPR